MPQSQQKEWILLTVTRFNVFCSITHKLVLLTLLFCSITHTLVLLTLLFHYSHASGSDSSVLFHYSHASVADSSVLFHYSHANVADTSYRMFCSIMTFAGTYSIMRQTADNTHSEITAMENNWRSTMFLNLSISFLNAFWAKIESIELCLRLLYVNKLDYLQRHNYLQLSFIKLSIKLSASQIYFLQLLYS